MTLISVLIALTSVLINTLVSVPNTYKYPCTSYPDLWPWPVSVSYIYIYIYTYIYIYITIKQHTAAAAAPRPARSAAPRPGQPAVCCRCCGRCMLFYDCIYIYRYICIILIYHEFPKNPQFAKIFLKI